ncbi:MAG: hypothetical protein RL757_1892 [Bacteroidota bacterium]|jgi:putative methyltransferase (TIGR04325 family)
MIYNFLLNQYFRHVKKSGWFGNYPTWQAATDDCKGYADDTIFQKVVAATRLVRDQKAAFERDGMAFQTPEADVDLLQVLKKCHENNPDKTKLTVLDFGGALGSSFFQNKSFWKNENIELENWVVVEQKHFVEIGKKEFEQDILKFEYDLETAIVEYSPDILLFNSVLQYLESPKMFFKIAESAKIPMIFIARTPSFSADCAEQSRVTKQIISPKIYAANYASWVFGNDFWNDLRIKYQVVEQKELLYGRYLVGNEPLFLKDCLLKLDN